jgi:hypothetical protein
MKDRLEAIKPRPVKRVPTRKMQAKEPYGRAFPLNESWVPWWDRWSKGTGHTVSEKTKIVVRTGPRVMGRTKKK